MRLGAGPLDGLVGGSDDGCAVPGNGEENPAVGGLGNHHGVRGAEKRRRQNEVRSLAHREQGLAVAVHGQHLLGEDAGGVEDGLCPQIEGGVGFEIAGMDPDGLAVVLDEPGRFHVVDGSSTQLLEGSHERNGVSCIVELAVVIEHTAAEAFGSNSGQHGESLAGREHARGPEGEPSGEPFVDLEAEAVVGKVEEAEDGNDEGEIVDEVGSVLKHQAALAQSIHDQGDVHLLEIAHAAVDELGAAAGGSLGEVRALDEGGSVATGGGFDGGPEAGGAASDDEHIPLHLLAESAQDLRAIAQPAVSSSRVHWLTRWSARFQVARVLLRSPGSMAGRKTRSTCHWLAMVSLSGQYPTASPAR